MLPAVRSESNPQASIGWHCDCGTSADVRRRGERPAASTLGACTASLTTRSTRWPRGARPWAMWSITASGNERARCAARILASCSDLSIRAGRDNPY